MRAVFPNEEGNLAAGLFARIKVPISEPHQALLVNDQAIGTKQGNNYILILNDKNAVEDRAVEVGQLYDGLREDKPPAEIGRPVPHR